MDGTSQNTFLRSLQLLSGALMAGLLVIGVAVTVALGENGTGETPVWGWAAVVVVALVATTVIPLVGYQITPIAPGTPAEEAKGEVRARLQSSTILRFSLAEAAGIVAVAVAFAVEEGGLYPLFLGIVVSEALMAWHVWPGDRVLNRTQEALEREGGQSYFREALDSPAVRP